MELYEHIVMAYLTKDPYVFVSPQYPIRSEGGVWSCPDFVALNFKERRVYVVEVSTAYSVTSLAKKIKDRDNQWIERLRLQLLANRVIDENGKWSFEILVFVRQGAKPSISSSTQGSTLVTVQILENLGAPWEWVRQ